MKHKINHANIKDWSANYDGPLFDGILCDPPYELGFMGKGWDDDVPIEAKMVTRAIEKAQNTVEARNAEIRKNVLKYDEVMNEQRKVIYARRDEVLEGVDLRSETMESLAAAVDGLPVVFLHGGPGSGCSPAQRRPRCRLPTAAWHQSRPRRLACSSFRSSV